MILLEQLADEAIRLRWQFVLDTYNRALDPETQVILRAALLAEWAFNNPALDRIAVDRETALGELEAKGITPDPGRTITAGPVTLTAVRRPSPVGHTYHLTRRLGQDVTQVGLAWLCTTTETAGPGRYLAMDTTGTYRGHCYGDSLEEALDRLAWAVRGCEDIQRAARRGDVQ